MSRVFAENLWQEHPYIVAVKEIKRKGHGRDEVAAN